jgi:hypothetical protein
MSESESEVEWISEEHQGNTRETTMELYEGKSSSTRIDIHRSNTILPIRLDDHGPEC